MMDELKELVPSSEDETPIVQFLRDQLSELHLVKCNPVQILKESWTKSSRLATCPKTPSEVWA
jgi:hypothetical protein